MLCGDMVKVVTCWQGLKWRHQRSSYGNGVALAMGLEGTSRLVDALAEVLCHETLHHSSVLLLPSVPSTFSVENSPLAYSRCQLCYVQVERSAQLERRGCDQDVWLSGDEASASGTWWEHLDCDNKGDMW